MCEESSVDFVIDTPSYSDFIVMDRAENDPEDVAEILDICESEEE